MAKTAKTSTASRWPRTVIFLGAGASCADGGPTQAQLLRGFFQTCRSAPSRLNRPGRQRMIDQLTDYFANVWGVDVTAANLDAQRFPTFEEALGLLELAESRGESFRGYGAGARDLPTRQLRIHLVSLIASYLEQKLRRAQRHHRALVESLQRMRALTTTIFVSLNYDLLIDNAIWDQGAAGIDYGITFRSGMGAVHANEVPLLKLHGSLNWLYCPTCNELDHYRGEKIVAQLPDGQHIATCGPCNGSRVPILIPPTFFKVMSNIFLQQIWKRAEEKLLGAERIIFCGYSFPDADLHIKYLLKRAEMNRTGATALPPRVFIINEHAGKTEDARSLEKDRYSRFFRNKAEMIWMDAGFSDFAANPGVIDDQTKWQRLGPGR